MSLRGAFRFDSTRHVYTVGHREVPAVGTIVKWSRGDVTDGPWMKEEHRDRGRAVHAATLAIDLGDGAQAVMSRTPQAWRPFVYAYCDFRSGLALRWTQLEQPMVSRHLMFAGTPDRVGTINDWPAILEIKTGLFADWHGVQTAGQDILLDRSTRRRYVVYLTKDGKFKLRQHTDAGDYLKFLTALSEFHAHERHESAQGPRAIRLREE